MEINFDENKLLEFAIRSHITRVFKFCLVEFDEIANRHDENMSKLAQILPEEQVKQLYLVDHFTEEERARLRKRILDVSNDSIRGLIEELKICKRGSE